MIIWTMLSSKSGSNKLWRNTSYIKGVFFLFKVIKFVYTDIKWWPTLYKHANAYIWRKSSPNNNFITYKSSFVLHRHKNALSYILRDFVGPMTHSRKSDNVRMGRE